MHLHLSRDLDETSEIRIDYVHPDQLRHDQLQHDQKVPDLGLAGIVALTGDAEDEADAAFKHRLYAIRDDIDLPAQFRLLIDRDQRHPGGRFYFQIEADRLDTYTGQPGTGRGGKAYLSPAATDSELIQAAFGLYNAYLHHEARETFLWRGRRVFGPHIDIQAHWEIAERYDARPAATTTETA